MPRLPSPVNQPWTDARKKCAPGLTENSIYQKATKSNFIRILNTFYDCGLNGPRQRAGGTEWLKQWIVLRAIGGPVLAVWEGCRRWVELARRNIRIDGLDRLKLATANSEVESKPLHAMLPECEQTRNAAVNLMLWFVPTFLTIDVSTFARLTCSAPECLLLPFGKERYNQRWNVGARFQFFTEISRAFLMKAIMNLRAVARRCLIGLLVLLVATPQNILRPCCCSNPAAFFTNPLLLAANSPDSPTVSDRGPVSNTRPSSTNRPASNFKPVTRIQVAACRSLSGTSPTVAPHLVTADSVPIASNLSTAGKSVLETSSFAGQTALRPCCRRKLLAAQEAATRELLTTRSAQHATCPKVDSKSHIASKSSVSLSSVSLSNDSLSNDSRSGVSLLSATVKPSSRVNFPSDSPSRCQCAAAHPTAVKNQVTFKSRLIETRLEALPRIDLISIARPSQSHFQAYLSSSLPASGERDLAQLCRWLI